MLTPEIARNILHTVNLQINSNTIFIKPVQTYSLSSRLNLYLDTRRALKQLYKSYPSQKITKQTLLSNIALLYSQFRQAVQEQDEPMLHRYLTNQLYQEWKDNPQTRFVLQPTIYNITIKQAQIHQSEYGKWIQCLIGMKYAGGGIAEHIVERKLGMMPWYARGWYFVKYQN